MNLVAGVGRALQGLLAHTWISKYCCSETFSSAASFSPESLPFFYLWGQKVGKPAQQMDRQTYILFRMFLILMYFL